MLHEPKARPLCDLLKLVQDESVAAIVTLNKEIFLWPNENHPVIEINGDVKLEHQKTRNLKSCDWITVKMTTATVNVKDHQFQGEVNFFCCRQLKLLKLYL